MAVLRLSEPNPKQKQFLQARKKHIGFGGRPRWRKELVGESQSNPFGDELSQDTDPDRAPHLPGTDQQPHQHHATAADRYCQV